ncbi:RNA pyrophosphohydrolase [Rickettsiales endosymbiont of Stachyamoeba lipophora]|uniref:RNA pyrophosphohydrolase n=1 Tax=Rickettsiales endosymbiont of Stachyamoeba lipophora TaxID=2486578 RepID=UPI000F6515BB|nr:RNA pyrophosphohydrolase [Rickettsiales endosymbiont of Stachyamoeba lipophora]AZL16183.1 RNA pyrophosphohydrolase [Rickettsiales endosymbiont of Stachyamoeba lipophora]
MNLNEALYLTLPYRPGVGAMVLNHENKVFVGKRIDNKSDAWQMPQGGIDENESPDMAVFRELEEETGLVNNNLKLISRSRLWFYYDIPDNLIPKLWEGRYRGQKQQWFLFKFYGKDSEININTEHPEFNEWQWVKIEDLPELIVPFKKKLYTEIIDEFKYYVDQLRLTKHC